MDTLVAGWLIIGLLVILLVIAIADDDIKVKHLLVLAFMGLVWPITLFTIALELKESVVIRKQKN